MNLFDIQPPRLTDQLDPSHWARQSAAILAADDKREEARRVTELQRERTDLLAQRKDVSGTPNGASGIDEIDIALTELDKKVAFVHGEHARRRTVYGW